jgi:hypothetical protein
MPSPDPARNARPAVSRRQFLSRVAAGAAGAAVLGGARPPRALGFLDHRARVDR